MIAQNLCESLNKTRISQLKYEFYYFSGSRTKDGNPILIFPDSRSQLNDEQIDLLLSYLLQLPPQVF